MITDDGKIHIKRYLAGFVPSIGQSISFGVGSAAESGSDKKMHFEIAKSNIKLVTYDFVSDRLIFKADVPDTFSGKVSEIGLFSASADYLASQFGARLIATFDSEVELWNEAGTSNSSVFNADNALIGSGAVRQTPAASATRSDAMTDLSIDLEQNASSDTFKFAYHVGNGNVSNIKFRFMTDNSNYYEFTLSGSAVTTGYKITEVAKSTAAATGSPSWGSIKEVRVSTTASSGGAAQVDFDGIRIDENHMLNSDYVMVARELLSEPYITEPGKIQEIEFAVGVSI